MGSLFFSTFPCFSQLFITPFHDLFESSHRIINYKSQNAPTILHVLVCTRLILIPIAVSPYSPLQFQIIRTETTLKCPRRKGGDGSFGVVLSSPTHSGGCFIHLSSGEKHAMTAVPTVKNTSSRPAQLQVVNFRYDFLKHRDCRRP